MPLPDYITGTVSITNGSTALTGSGTAWDIAALKEGDIFYKAGYAILIASVDSDTGITLADAWPGTTLADATYAIRYAPDNSRVQGTTRQLLDTLREGFSLVGTSTTSLAIATGSKTFDVSASNLGWSTGARLRAASDADGTNFMEGVVTAYADESLTLDVDLVGGSGTKADWTVNLAGQPGVDGAPGEDGAGVPAGGTTGQVLAKASDDDEDTAWIDPPATGREVLAAAQTYYVATTGSDSNDGLTSGAAFLTPQKAYDTVCLLDVNGKTVTIQLANGTYTSGLDFSKPWTGGGAVTINGDTTTPANVIISVSGSGACCVTAAGTISGVLTIQGVKLVASGAGASGIFHKGTGVIQIQNLDFGACAGAHLFTNTPGAFISIIGPYTISGSSPYHWQCTSCSGISIQGSQTITLVGTPAFSGAFALSRRCASVQCNTATFSGSATGARYRSDYCGVIFTNGGGASFLPGSSAGTADSTTGGIYG